MAMGTKLLVVKEGLLMLLSYSPLWLMPFTNIGASAEMMDNFFSFAL